MTYFHVITVNGIQCPRCSEKLWSQYGHDFHYCRCGYCFVDGGRNYLRYGWGAGGKEDIRPKEIELEVEDPRWMWISIHSRLYGGEG